MGVLTRRNGVEEDASRLQTLLHLRWQQRHEAKGLDAHRAVAVMMMGEESSDGSGHLCGRCAFGNSAVLDVPPHASGRRGRRRGGNHTTLFASLQKTKRVRSWKTEIRLVC